MNWIARPRPSVGNAALVVACIALVAALAGDSIAGLATKALTKKEKRQTRKIATKKVEQLAPGLSVAFAAAAGSATSADQVDGVSAANPFAQAQEGDPDVHLATFGNVVFELFCSGGINSTILSVRTTGGTTAVYHELGTGAALVVDEGGIAAEQVFSNNTATVGFTVNGGGSQPAIASGMLTLRHNSSAASCQIYGTMLGG